ncbi:MAG: hypothetical protein IJ636_02770, partial [Bacteroidales bacterium]|nr:hypothetical protein [Bacteroidales bacterium]
MKRLFILVSALFLAGCPMLLADGFRHPAQEIEAITMSAQLPSFNYSGDYKRAAVGFRSCRHVPVAELAASEARIGGVRIDPLNFSETRENYFDGLRLFDVASGNFRDIKGLPGDLRVKFLTWSPSGRYLAFTLSFPDHVELWRVDAEAVVPEAEKLTAVRVNTIFGTPLFFLDDDHILFKAVPDDHRQAPRQTIARSSVVQEVLGEKKSIRTYQDLMNGPADEELYDYCCTSQLAVWSPQGVRKVGAPAIYRSLDPSPDGNYAIVVTEHHPYSYVESHRSFP